MILLPDWLRHFIERRLTVSYVRMICTLVLAVNIIVLAVSFATSNRGKTSFGPFLGADFGAFYVGGKIFNEYSPDQIYDIALHEQVYKEIFPDVPLDSHLAYANAPFFILPFTLLAHLPYAWAYLVWLLISLGLYCLGFLLVWKTLEAMPSADFSTALLLALSFFPFAVECLAGGQTSAFGFFAFALALTSESRSKLLSGAILALCSYKPTLLLLTIPMLIVSRRYLAFLGFVIGNAVLGLVSLATVGWRGCIAYVNTLLFYGSASVNAESGLRTWKYVDITSFFRLLLGNHTLLRLILTVTVFLIVLPFLVQVWRKANRKFSDESELVWAVTLTWTLVLNIYLGIYDTTLVVLSVLLLTNFLYSRSGSTNLSPVYKGLLLALYVVPWMTQPLARLSHLQLYTVVLSLLGAYQLLQFSRTSNKPEVSVTEQGAVAT